MTKYETRQEVTLDEVLNLRIEGAMISVAREDFIVVMDDRASPPQSSAHSQASSSVLAILARTIRDFPIPISSASIPPPVSVGSTGDNDPVMRCL